MYKTMFTYGALMVESYETLDFEHCCIVVFAYVPLLLPNIW